MTIFLQNVRLKQMVKQKIQIKIVNGNPGWHEHTKKIHIVEINAFIQLYGGMMIIHNFINKND